MQTYKTIVGVIELRMQKVGYATTQKRYGIGSSTVTLIMKRFKELGISLEELKVMPPKEVEAAFYPPENLKRTEKPLPDFFQIHARMAAMERFPLAGVQGTASEWLPTFAVLRAVSLLPGGVLRADVCYHAGGASPRGTNVH